VPKRFGKFRPKYLEALITGKRLGKFSRRADHGSKGEG
jgi:hypothetical protein